MGYLFIIFLGYMSFDLLYSKGINCVSKHHSEKVGRMMMREIISLLCTFLFCLLVIICAVWIGYESDNSVESLGVKTVYSKPYVIAANPIFTYVDAESGESTYIKKSGTEYKVLQHNKDGALDPKGYNISASKIYETQKDFHVEEIGRNYKKYRNCAKDSIFPGLSYLLGKDGQIMEEGVTTVNNKYKIYVPEGSLAL